MDRREEQPSSSLRLGRFRGRESLSRAVLLPSGPPIPDATERPASSPSICPLPGGLRSSASLLRLRPWGS
eukprot:10271084-Lingulodinium_polyedra.AAC.1